MVRNTELAAKRRRVGFVIGLPARLDCFLVSSSLLIYLGIPSMSSWYVCI